MPFGILVLFGNSMDSSHPGSNTFVGKLKIILTGNSLVSTSIQAILLLEAYLDVQQFE